MNKREAVRQFKGVTMMLARMEADTGFLVDFIDAPPGLQGLPDTAAEQLHNVLALLDAARSKLSAARSCAALAVEALDGKHE